MTLLEQLGVTNNTRVKIRELRFGGTILDIHDICYGEDIIENSKYHDLLKRKVVNISPEIDEENNNSWDNAYLCIYLMEGK